MEFTKYDGIGYCSAQKEIVIETIYNFCDPNDPDIIAKKCKECDFYSRKCISCSVE